MIYALCQKMSAYLGLARASDDSVASKKQIELFRSICFKRSETNSAHESHSVRKYSKLDVSKHINKHPIRTCIMTGVLGLAAIGLSIHLQAMRHNIRGAKTISDCSYMYPSKSDKPRPKTHSGRTGIG
jgi:hypothetical protein